LAPAMNLEIGPEWRRVVKATGLPAIHLSLDHSIFACTLPWQRQPGKASIQG